jgi:hypothetical protein
MLRQTGQKRPAETKPAEPHPKRAAVDPTADAAAGPAEEPIVTSIMDKHFLDSGSPLSRG